MSREIEDQITGQTGGIAQPALRAGEIADGPLLACRAEKDRSRLAVADCLPKCLAEVLADRNDARLPGLPGRLVLRERDAPPSSSPRHVSGRGTARPAGRRTATGRCRSTGTRAGGFPDCNIWKVKRFLDLS